MRTNASDSLARDRTAKDSREVKCRRTATETDTAQPSRQGVLVCFQDYEELGSVGGPWIPGEEPGGRVPATPNPRTEPNRSEPMRTNLNRIETAGRRLSSARLSAAALLLLRALLQRSRAEAASSQHYRQSAVPNSRRKPFRCPLCFG